MQYHQSTGKTLLICLRLFHLYLELLTVEMASCLMANSDAMWCNPLQTINTLETLVKCVDFVQFRGPCGGEFVGGWDGIISFAPQSRAHNPDVLQCLLVVDFGSNACCPKTGYGGYGPTFSHEVIKTSRFLSVVSLCPYARIPGLQKWADQTQSRSSTWPLPYIGWL